MIQSLRSPDPGGVSVLGGSETLPANTVNPWKPSPPKCLEAHGHGKRIREGSVTLREVGACPDPDLCTVEK